MKFKKATELLAAKKQRQEIESFSIYSNGFVAVKGTHPETGIKGWHDLGYLTDGNIKEKIGIFKGE